jgi:hypothetical protein
LPPSSWRAILVVGDKMSAQVVKGGDALDVLHLSMVRSHVGIKVFSGKSMFEQKSLTSARLDKYPAQLYATLA